MATADTTLSAACAAALERAGSAAVGCDQKSALPLPPPALEPGLGLGGDCAWESGGLSDSLDLEKLHSLMGDFDPCG